MSDSRPPNFHHHVHLLRGFTIVWIVATHATTMPLVVSRMAGQSHPIAGEFQSLLFYNSTVMFALISGLLYSLVLARRSTLEFYRGKLRNVLAPYLVVSALYAFLGLTLSDGLNPPDSAAEFIDRYAIGVITGTTMSVLWYIPVILLLFILTPMFAIALRSRIAPAFVCAALALPFFFSRIWPEFSFNNLAYFAAPYVLGMWLGGAYDARSQQIARYRWWIVAIAVFTSVWSFGTTADWLPPYPYDWRTQLYYLQKLSLSLLMILAFQRLEAWRSRPLERLGEDAFAIYFLHMLPILAYSIVMVDIGASLSTFEVMLHGLVLTAVSTLLTLLLIAAVRRVAGKNSRLLIGS